MIYSMTAFACAERHTPHGVLECELRAVNHRFLELGLRLPDELRTLEPALRARLQSRLARGKVEATLRLCPGASAPALELNAPLLEQLGAVIGAIKARFPDAQVNALELLQYPGVLQAPAGSTAQLHDAALALLDETIADFLTARGREGAHLSAVLLERADAIAAITSDVRALMPHIRAAQRARLDARLGEIARSGDPNRLEQELVIALQKLDVDEELDRLDSHLAELRRVLGQPDPAPAGRRLDFLLQEVNREANTLGSKSVDSRTAQAVVELKVLIDQMREQVQNVE